MSHVGQPVSGRAFDPRLAALGVPPMYVGPATTVVQISVVWAEFVGSNTTACDAGFGAVCPASLLL